MINLTTFAVLVVTAFPLRPATPSVKLQPPEIGFVAPIIQPVKIEPLVVSHVEAPVTVEAIEVAPSPPPVPEVVSAVVPGCGDNFYANYIYMKESGCSLYNPNPDSGACGLGQFWPCSKLWSACPVLTYECENAAFTRYAFSAYGGWEQSYNHWLAAHSW